MVSGGLSRADNNTAWGNFHPLEVGSRGSETQLQVGEKLTKIT